MAGNRRRSSRRKRPTRTRSAAPTSPAGAGLAPVLDEVELVLDTPLAELMESEEERAHAQKLTRQASAAPAIGRLRELVAFVGDGRRATQAGKLTPADAIALARRLGAGEPDADGVRSMDDLPEVAHAFHWAIAAELLAARRTRIVPGPRAGELERDPLAAWFKAAITLLEHGVLDGFRRGWRKRYVELLDAEMAALLAAIAAAGGTVPLTAIEDDLWEHVAGAYGYAMDDRAEREWVAWLVRAIVAQLADLGAAARDGDDVVLTDLGGALTTAVLAIDGDPE